MKFATRLLCLMLVLVSVVFGQSLTQSGSNASVFTTSAIGTSGSAAFSTICCATSSGQWVTGSSNVIYGVPAETRKDDGKGITLALLKLAATPWNALRLAPDTYVALAQRIGLSSAGTDQARMLQAIHDAHLHAFPYAKVDDYLYRKALHQGANVRWVWEPVRDSDSKAAANYAGQTASGYVVTSQYSREIPDRILADIERMMDCAPEDTIFLASDYKVVNPDPFLAVTTPKMLAAGVIFIVDSWDEPGFTEKDEQPSGSLSASVK